MTTYRPTYGSLFTGVGGMDMGFDTHMDCRWQVEWDKNCQSILRRHWPDVPKYLDVQEVYGSELLPVDVITFGSPCQDLSVAGKRAGIDGGRSSMFFEAARIIKEMQDATDGRFPRVTVWENVPGALSSRGGDDFQRVLEEMDELGSVLSEWHILDARWFGVPQRRRRIFLVSVFDSAVAARCGSQILPVAARSGWDPPSRRPEGEGVAGGVGAGVGGVGGGFVAGDGAGESGAVGFRRLAHGFYRDDDSASTLAARDYKGATDLVVPVVSDQILFDGKRNDDFRLYGETAPTLPAMMGTGGNNTPMVGQSIAFSVREDAKANSFSATETDTALAVTALQPSPQSHHAQLFIVQGEPIPIQDGRDMEKRQNGLGVGVEGDPSYTLDTTGGQAVGQPVSPVLSFDTQFGSNANVFVEASPTLKASQASPSVLMPMVFEPGAMSRTDAPRFSTEVAATLRANMGDNQLAVAQPVDGPMDPLCFQPGTASRLGGGVWVDSAPTLRAESHAGDNSPHVVQDVVAPTLTAANDPSRSPQSSEVTEQVGAVFASQYAVRRLCPEECELLMGWPVGHTRWTDTGKEQADSHRYKQCGNGVASPVARWIAGHLARLLED